MKTIFLTFSATVAAIAVAAWLFLNSMLGMFGLAATSVDTLHDLAASKQVVERLKQRHEHKKLKVTSRLAKRSSKRVASTALAAATIGTVGVVVTVASLEVADYCEEKKDLQEDANILYGTQVDFDLERCVDDAQEDSAAILGDLKNSSLDSVSSAFGDSARYSAEKWAAVKESLMEAWQATGTASERYWEAVKLWVAE